MELNWMDVILSGLASNRAMGCCVMLEATRGTVTVGIGLHALLLPDTLQAAETLTCFECLCRWFATMWATPQSASPPQVARRLWWCSILMKAQSPRALHTLCVTLLLVRSHLQCDINCNSCAVCAASILPQQGKAGHGRMVLECSSPFATTFTRVAPRCTLPCNLREGMVQ